MTRPLDALLFDKDGTLFHFGETWNSWGLQAITHFAAGDTARRAALAQGARFDLDRQAFHPDSPIIAGTNREAAACLLPALPEYDLPQIEAELTEMAAATPLAPATDLGPLLEGFASQGYALGVMTNDAEAAAFAHLDSAGIRQHFDFIAGFDSGFGAKPSPAPLLAFCDQLALAPDRVAMVGDSTHDLGAGRAAGMRTVGVLTGPALAEDLAPLADAILPDIGHLPDWLASL